MGKSTTLHLAPETINIGLSEDQRAGIVASLNTLLADEFLLYTKTRNYHWNLRGPRFHDLHKFFENQYEQLAEIIDEVAENARQFGGYATGTMTEYLDQTRLKEEPRTVPPEDDMLRNLLTDHETVIKALRPDIEKAAEDYGAADASDFLTAILEQHNKMAWMLRSFIR
ncbi:MAG TPA: DNA starvation/stationary phase protection protein [Bryobacteraceae bacterium]|nr:DNA starvation/stationary phase protection protein [Bryobacteraceae bacterium]